MRVFIPTLISISCLYANLAQAEFCISAGQYCRGPGDGSSNHSTTAPAFPTTSSVLSINPAGVPTEDQWGIGAIVYKGAPDFLLVKGTGRLGAAISLTSGEDTFYGPPSFETYADYLARERDRAKYNSRKLAGGGSGTLYDNGHDDLTHFRLSLGILARYNLQTSSILPGAGVNAIFGPFNLGFATSLDETLVTNASTIGSSIIRDQQTTYSLGIFLTSVALDYSILNINVLDSEPIAVQLYTASLLTHRWIVTASYRIETSDRLYYQHSSNSLISKQVKTNYFGGVQYAPFKYLQVGVFFNYYLLNDISVGATVFF